jgi:hypothetical protein
MMKSEKVEQVFKDLPDGFWGVIEVTIQRGEAQIVKITRTIAVADQNHKKSGAPHAYSNQTR